MGLLIVLYLPTPPSTSPPPQPPVHSLTFWASHRDFFHLPTLSHSFVTSLLLSNMVARLSLLSVFVTLVAVATSQQCYGVDGSALDNTHTPCNPSATHSACCASGDICMSNGLCMGTQDDSIGKIFSRGCTDATGKDVACASICPTSMFKEPHHVFYQPN